MILLQAGRSNQKTQQVQWIRGPINHSCTFSSTCKLAQIGFDSDCGVDIFGFIFSKRLLKIVLVETFICQLYFALIFWRLPLIKIGSWNSKQCARLLFRNVTDFHCLCRDLGGFPYNGLKNLYDGGGYAFTLGNTAKSSRNKLEALKNLTWIDRHTAAIFVEFTVSEKYTKICYNDFQVFVIIRQQDYSHITQARIKPANNRYNCKTVFLFV